jgi:hypothetical protein
MTRSEYHCQEPLKIDFYRKDGAASASPSSLIKKLFQPAFILAIIN